MSKKNVEAKYGSPDRPLKINLGNDTLEIPCYVLEDGRRVIVQRGLLKALGIQPGGMREDKYKEFGGVARLVSFLEKNQLIDMKTNQFTLLPKEPIKFDHNKTEFHGYEATVLQDIVRSISKAYLKGKLNKRQEEIGRNAELLDDAFAKVGIIALVDEATGFQEVREKDALKQFLEKFLLDEKGKWVKTFNDEFFEMIFKMKGWTWYYASTKKPSVVGHYINDLVYSRLGPDVLKELRKRNLNPATGRKKGAHHQFLSPDYGNPKLKEHLASLIALGKASGYNWNNFKRMVERAFPQYTEQQQLDFKENEE